MSMSISFLRKSVWALCLSLSALLIAAGSAIAEGGANVRIELGSPDAAGVPRIIHTLLPDEGFETFAVQESEFDMPRGFKVNNADGLQSCGVGREAFETGANPPNCPAGSIIGSAYAEPDPELSPDPVRGTMYLLESDRNNEPVKIGVYLPLRLGEATVHYRLYADVTMEGNVGSERIKVKFNASRFGPVRLVPGLPEVAVKKYVLTLYGEGDVHQGFDSQIHYDENGNEDPTNGEDDPNKGERTHTLIRLPASCGVYSWDAKLKIDNQIFRQPAESITVNVNRNCNAPARRGGLLGLGGPYYNNDLFKPVMGLQVEGGAQPDVTYLLKDHTMDLRFLGRGFGQYEKKHKANNTAAGLQSIRDARITLSVSPAGGFEVDLSRARVGARLGRTTMAVYAVGRRYDIEGEVKRTQNGAQLIFANNVPAVIKDATEASRVVIDGTFSTVRNGNIVAHYLTFNSLPTAYEVRELDFTFEGASGATVKNCSQAVGPILIAGASFTSDRPPLRGDDVTVAPCVLQQQSTAGTSTSGTSQKTSISSDEINAKLLGLIPADGQKLLTSFPVPSKPYVSEKPGSSKKTSVVKAPFKVATNPGVGAKSSTSVGSSSGKEAKGTVKQPAKAVPKRKAKRRCKGKRGGAKLKKCK